MNDRFYSFICYTCNMSCFKPNTEMNLGDSFQKKLYYFIYFDNNKKIWFWANISYLCWRTIVYKIQLTNRCIVLVSCYLHNFLALAIACTFIIKNKISSHNQKNIISWCNNSNLFFNYSQKIIIVTPSKQKINYKIYYKKCKEW